MADLPADFDLKLMPDWLKEPVGKNPYADYQGGDDERRGGRGRGDWGDGGRGERRGGKPGNRPRGPGDDRGRKDGPRSPGSGPGGKRPDRPAGRDDRRGKPGEPRKQEGRPEGRHESRQEGRGPGQRPQGPQGEPANVTIEFFPDESCAVSIARQIKSTHRAYSLFDLARMFLAKPERHRLKVTAKSVAEPLHQIGEDGPLAMDKTAAERAAFPMLRRKYYVEVSEPREPIKGNFSNVARCRANGVLLGPTNHHGYQPGLRKLYDERFSRRMSFQEFQREIEVVNDPALVEQWKEQARTVTVYHLKPQEKPRAAKEKAPEPAAAAAAVETPATGELVEETTAVHEEPAQSPAEAPVEATAEAAGEAAPAETAPEAEAAAEEVEAAATEQAPYDGPVFNSLAEVEHHFREHYLPGLIRTGTSFYVSGGASRDISDRGISTAVRMAWEQERGFPGQMMHHLRQQFSRAGLHVFKHRKRMQFVSLIRPMPMEAGNLSPSVAEILQVVKDQHPCNRTTLATAILGADEAAADPARKTSLATDFRWLIETGRVIEFSDGRLELPVTPVAPPAAPAEGKAAPEHEAGGQATGEAAAAAEEPAAVAEPVAAQAPVATEEPVAASEPVMEHEPLAPEEPAEEPVISPVSPVSEP